MLTKTIRALAIAISGVYLLGFNAIAQTNVPSTFKHITIDGSFNDWTGVPLAYTTPVGSTNAIQYQNVYIANDQTNLYVRFTLYSPRPNAMANSFDNIFIDADTNALTGFPADGGAVGIGSEMLIQWGAGYQEKNGLFNEGAINNLGWNIAGSPDSTDFEFVISLGATYASDGTSVFASNTIAILLEGDNTTYTSVEFAPPYGGLVYTFATQPTTLTTNVPLITLTNSWQANAAGRDLGTNWLGQTYDDTSTGWTAGSGLLGYTPSPGSYPAINTPLVNGPNTYYFRTHFAYTNDADNVAFVVTNYLSDGAVYYLNGNEIRRVRMPGGVISYATAASTTNSPAGHADIFGIDGSSLQFGDNILEVETHQAPASSADMVFGLSLTATTSYSILNASTNLPADYNVLAGQSITFVSDVIGSGPLTYQWFFDGTQAIPGANASTYTIPYVLTNNAGTYSLQVSNSFSGVTTRAAILSVSNTPVVITTQPVNQAAVEGRSAYFSAVVSGTPLIQYQWSFNGVPISGATNSSYVIPVTYPTNAGVYQLTANNPASTTNSSQVNLTVLLDNLPPKFTTINAAANQIVVTFSEPVDTVTSENISKYSVSGGVTVLSAVQSSSNPAQVTLTTGGGLNSGTVYTLTVNGVADLFGNVADVSGQFTPVTTITIDGSFDDWAGVTPIYSSAAPSGNTGAADFKDIYTYDDANYYYFYVVLWSDIDPSAGHFPAYVNMFFNTDNNVGTGYGPGALGSDLLIQSGYGYDERNGSFNNGAINGLNWFCLPAAPGTNFEFSISKAATYASDNAPVFTTNVISFIFQGMNTSYVVVNQVPASGIITYNDATTTPVAPLPLGKLSVASLPNKQAAIVWDLPGTLQVSSSLVGATWTNLPAASSPYVVPVASGNLFFRLTE